MVCTKGLDVKFVIRRRSLMLQLALGSAMVVSFGCETDSYMNPSVTGYYEHTPTTMPVLERIDVIEPAEVPLGINGPPEPQDLVPNSLQYRLAAGDVLAVEIYELIAQGKTEAAVRVVDPGGYIRLPTINEVKASGLTIEELRESIRAKLEVFIRSPVVTVDIQEGRSFEFTIQGAIQNAGIFALNKPNFRLTHAIALAGGADVVTERVLIIRSMSTEVSTEEAAAADATAAERDSTKPGSIVPQVPTNTGVGAPIVPVDIESLIEKLSGGIPPVAAPTPAPEAVPTPAPEPAPASPPSPGSVSGAQSPPPIDIDTLEPVSVIDSPTIHPQSATQRTAASQLANEGDSFIFDVNSQQWIRLRGVNAPKQPVSISDPSFPAQPGVPLTAGAARTNRSTRSGAVSEMADPRAAFKTRIIEVDYDRLVRGDQSQNIVIRPGDEIYLQFPPIGVVYIDGEISRPGSFNLPSYGRLTLSRLIATAGGLTQIAIPERVDLVRRLPGGREAAIRINLTAIRNMGEPDIVLKKDDHIIIGTNFWATPLAVFRNGLRMTYGFGFLLDRNFGNDVFGAPPENGFLNP